MHLKEKLERKRQEKKQGRLTIQQPAFSDDTTHSTTSEPSTTTTSSSESEEVMVKGKGSNIVSLFIYLFIYLFICQNCNPSCRGLS